MHTFDQGGTHFEFRGLLPRVAELGSIRDYESGPGVHASSMLSGTIVVE